MNTTRKIATFLMVGTLAFAGKTAVAQAAEKPEVPLAGITLLLEEAYQTSQNAHEEIVKYLLSETASEYANLAFAKVTNYVNIRDKANENGEILGKLYDNSAATILEKEKDWYKIKSGSVTGYIKSDFLIAGEKAEEIAKSTGTRWVTVTTTTLKVREKSSLDASVLTLVPMGEELKVIKENDGWIKVAVDENISGFLSADYVKIRTEYEEAISITEEQERLAEEAAAREAEANQAQERAATTRSYSTANTSRSVTNVERSTVVQQDNNSENTAAENEPSESVTSQEETSESNSSDQSSLRSSVVSYALKFKGNPYVWGGTSLTNGADCSGFTQSVFRNFGIQIPRTSRSQAASGRRVSVSDLQKGDLIFYARSGRINHVAIYIGGGQVIHASSPSTGIKISNYNYRTPYKAVSYIN